MVLRAELHPLIGISVQHVREAVLLRRDETERCELYREVVLLMAQFERILINDRTVQRRTRRTDPHSGVAHHQSGEGYPWAMRVQLDRIRVEGVEPVDTAEEDLAVGGLEGHRCVEFQALHPVTFIIRANAPVTLVQTTDPCVRGEPDPIKAINFDGIDHVVR